MTTETSESLLDLIPERPDSGKADSSITKYVDNLFEERIALLKRCCKTECLDEELRAVAREKEALEHSFLTSLKRYATGHGYGNPASWHLAWDLKYPQPDPRNMDELALRFFLAEARRKGYQVRTTWETKPSGDVLYARRHISVSL